MIKPVLSLDMEDPLEFIRKYGSFEIVKVGHNLAINGRKILDELQNMGLKVILDLKFCDIPSTVSRSIRSWDHDVIVGFTVHSASGIESIKAAIDSTDKMVFSVIKLTSIKGELKDYLDLTLKLDDIGSNFVLPGSWAVELRGKLKGRFLIPGIRMKVSPGDQVDVITINKIKQLNDFAVIGREVYLSKDPIKRIKEIKEMIG